jgi:hypothetical protein
MIILHNHMSRTSREFVATHGEGNTVISWYEGGREVWTAAGGTDKVSTFPSIMVDIPAHKIPERLGVNDMILPEVDVAAQQGMIREPTSMLDIQNWIDTMNVELAASAAAGMPVDPLSIETLDHSDDIVARMKE